MYEKVTYERCDFFLHGLVLFVSVKVDESEMKVRIKERESVGTD